MDTQHSIGVFSICVSAKQSVVSLRIDRLYPKVCFINFGLCALNLCLGPKISLGSISNSLDKLHAGISLPHILSNTSFSGHKRSIWMFMKRRR